MPIDGLIEANDGYALHCVHYANGKKPLLLVHGLAMDIDSWHHQIERFRNEYSVAAYDQIGHGKSSKPKEKAAYSVERLVDDLARVSDALRLERFLLAGFSIGGSVAMKYAKSHPERVERLVAINSPYSMDCIKESFFSQLAVAMSMPKMLIGFGLDGKQVWEYQGQLSTHRKCFLAMEKHVISNYVNAAKRHREEMFELKMPHLLLYSTDDEIVKPMPPSGANYRMIQGGHHYVIAQKHAEVNGIMADFLAAKTF